MVEMLVGMEALEGVVLTVLEREEMERSKMRSPVLQKSSASTTGVDLEFKNKERLGKWRAGPADPSMTDDLNCPKQADLLIDVAYTPKAD